MVGTGLMGRALLVMSKQVVVASEGYAVACGLGLALWCDLRIASDSTVRQRIVRLSEAGHWEEFQFGLHAIVSGETATGAR